MVKSSEAVASDGFPRFDLEDHVALVTGAARGLGRAIALTLANAGAHVALGLRDVSTGAELRDEIGALGRKALPLQMDVTDLDQVKGAIDEAVERFGRLDVLVNNAGLGPENPAEDVREEDFDLTFDVNVKGTFFASQAAGRVMIEQATAGSSAWARRPASWRCLGSRSTAPRRPRSRT